jgi:hypothetical protein
MAPEAKQFVGLAWLISTRAHIRLLLRTYIIHVLSFRLIIPLVQE